MKWNEKLKYKILQGTYGKKTFNKFPRKVSNVMDEVDEYLENVFDGKRKKKKKRRRRF